MNALWTIEGCDWQEHLVAPIDSNPIEIATRALESILDNNMYDNELSLGMIIMITHDKMKSIDETFVCYMPTILANAGYYTESDNLQKKIDLVLK
jgi:hypothetical protein